MNWTATHESLAVQFWLMSPMCFSPDGVVIGIARPHMVVCQ